ncbi:MAG: beta-propeller domain-containing protein [archaeon]|nr:beta-propeller domain-containing protein [archaeon]MCR4323494.1 beta-propeller domain-containing protein [Nanoarchaeota archaeon]
MAKDFDIIDMDDEKTGTFAEALKNETSRKILNYLKKNKSTITDIADSLKLPVSTVHYNIQKLQKAGLVKVHDFHWSPKGNKVFIYTISNKVMVFRPDKMPFLEVHMKAILSIFLVAIALVAIVAYPFNSNDEPTMLNKFNKFSSEKELLDALESAKDSGGFGDMVFAAFGGAKLAVMETAATSNVGGSSGADYSETNVQVAGVDEADIIKTDGEYIYAISDGKLIIAKAYPESSAEILFEGKVGDFYANELFIGDDKILIFGTKDYPQENYGKMGIAVGERMPYYYSPSVSVRLFDVSDRENPEQIRSLEFEGGYITSRMIGSDVYFVVNSYPSYEDWVCGDVVPLYAEARGATEIKSTDLVPIAPCTDIGYIDHTPTQNFLTLASISIDDENKEVEKETILGYGENVYASIDNLYIAQTNWNLGDEKQKTVLTRFSLDDGKIEFEANGEVPGHILNQFSMDEYDNYFRIATTVGEVWNSEEKSTNNVYVLDEDLKITGTLEGLAPGESIYSVRFMGDRGYVVTFKKVDPLFVIDLGDTSNPMVLGKLKIPGYSDYLHPYDETHLIGIGKDAVDAEEELSDARNLDFAWYQGVKMAIFDVSDVENPIEMYKVTIGDRGTDSEALHNHKAFLFDKEKELLVLPITLAEIQGEQKEDNQYGDITFQGAYVYNLNLEDGFELRGRISHHDSENDYLKYGYYPDYNYNIQRSLYIGDILYTLSGKRLQLNDLDSLEKLKILNFI